MRAVELRGKAQDLALADLDEMQLEERFARLREDLGPVPGPGEAGTSDPSLAGTLQRQLARVAVR